MTLIGPLNDVKVATCRCGAMVYATERAADLDRMWKGGNSFPRTCPTCQKRATDHEYIEGNWDPDDAGRCAVCDGRAHNHR